MLERWNGPTSALANALKAALLQRDVYAFCRWNMLFVAPPLSVTEDELGTGVRAIDEAPEIADRVATTGKVASWADAASARGSAGLSPAPSAVRAPSSASPMR